MPQSGDEITATRSEDGATAIGDAETQEAVAVATLEPTTPTSRAADRPSGAATKHISKDYGYVRAEIRRIAVVGGFLIVSLLITALLRN